MNAQQIQRKLRTLVNSPSSVAVAITTTSVNGWKFLSVKDAQGQEKGTLKELRDEFDDDENAGQKV